MICHDQSVGQFRPSDPVQRLNASCYFSPELPEVDDAKIVDFLGTDQFLFFETIKQILKVPLGYTQAYAAEPFA